MLAATQCLLVDHNRESARLHRLHGLGGFRRGPARLSKPARRVDRQPVDIHRGRVLPDRRLSDAPRDGKLPQPHSN